MEDTGKPEVDVAIDDASTVAEEAKAGAREALEAGKERTRSFFEEQKDVVAQRVTGFADALRTTARNLDKRLDKGSTEIAERAAEGMERFARTLRERDVRGILAETEEFARRSPMMFVGGAVTAGFLLARFLKSSHERTNGGHAAPGQQYQGSDEPAEVIRNPSGGEAC